MGNWDSCCVAVFDIIREIRINLDVHYSINDMSNQNNDTVFVACHTAGVVYTIQ